MIDIDMTRSGPETVISVAGRFITVKTKDALSVRDALTAVYEAGRADKAQEIRAALMVEDKS